ncbi:glycosyltransferase family 39 protein, partial [Candidatus Collierbacteria bacterium]|nr:glycosyltransferase family 39 protein [Candidatus Collierbacteria bacterium]
LAHLTTYRLAPSLGLDKAGRLTSVVISLVSIVFLYLIVRKLSGTQLALLSTFIYSILPFSIFYSRVILPEPLMIAFFLISFYLFLQKGYFSFFLSAAFLALALLVKPYAIFFTLPFIYWWWINRKEKRFTFPLLVAYFLIAFSPLLAWRIWIKQFPEGIPASAWLYNNLGIRLRPAWSRWLFGERIGKLVLGYWGLIPFGIGFLALRKIDGWIYRLLLVGVIAYFVVFAGGNVQHDYYQAIIIPYLAIVTSIGLLSMVRPRQEFSGISGILLAFFCFGMMLFLSWYEIRGYYQINNPAIVEAGKVADKILPKNARVIANYNGDTAFLYQTNRFGWPAITTDLATMIKGESDVYYVSVNLDNQTKAIMDDKRHQVVERNARFVIIKLFVHKQ